MFENLQLGSSGQRVVLLQQKLKELGLYNALINGEFGLSTEVGVKAYQKQMGLDETGIVDSTTWNRLNNNGISNISLFSSIAVGPSYDIRDVQIKLKALLYYTGDINGEYDLETENAVKRFQLNNGITADGNLNAATINLINTLYGNLNDCAKDEILPDNDTTDNTYTVVSGDTLWSIARMYNTTVDEIKRINNLTSNVLKIGQKLIIPNMSSDDMSQYTKYIVQSGDTLYSIAIRFNTSVDEIKRLNNLTNNFLQVGQILNIPDVDSNYLNYVVVRGDTLYKIAQDYNISVNTLRKVNNLTNDNLSIGQVLRIPINDLPNYINYTVQRGDTLYSIARKYSTTVDEIIRLNNLANTTLSIGQVLKLPNN